MEFWKCPLAVYEVTLRAVETLELPPYKGSSLDGALDSAFRRVACLRRKDSCPNCPTCPYAAIFEPRYVWLNGRDNPAFTRRYQEPPRPYVLEPPLDTKKTYESGEAFAFRLLLFGRSVRYFPWFIIALQALEQIGIGRKRGRIEVVEIRSLHPLTGAQRPIYRQDYEAGLFPNESLQVMPEEICRIPSGLIQEEVTLEFLTPTRLKSCRTRLRQPTFLQLVTALVRRAQLLSLFYGDGTSTDSMSALLQESESVSVRASHLVWRDRERFSSRQQQPTPLGGITGTITYAGKSVSLFRSLLLLGEFTHVGKTYCGMGKYRVVL